MYLQGTVKTIPCSPQLRLDSSTSKSRITAFLGFEFHYRLDIIFDLELAQDDKQ
jgi:hypothetical protein